MANPLMALLDQAGIAPKGSRWSVLGAAMRPLGALQAAAVAPIAKSDYQSTNLLGQAGEAFATSGKAFMEEMFPSGEVDEYGNVIGRPEYEAQVREKYMNKIPEKFHGGVDLALQVVTDPAVVAFPFLGPMKRGLARSAQELTSGQKEAGPIANAMKEFYAMSPVSVKDESIITKLAAKADKGEQEAFDVLMDKVKAEVPKKPKFRSVAMKIKDKVFRGNPGELHVDIYERLPQKYKDQATWDTGGFITWEGEYLNRPQAAKYLDEVGAEAVSLRKRGILQDVDIPIKFESSEAADEWAKRVGGQEHLPMLEQQRMRLGRESNELRLSGDFQGALDVGTQAQFIREIIEDIMGTAPKGFGPKN